MKGWVGRIALVGVGGALVLVAGCQAGGPPEPTIVVPAAKVAATAASPVTGSSPAPPAVPVAASSPMVSPVASPGLAASPVASPVAAAASPVASPVAAASPAAAMPCELVLGFATMRTLVGEQTVGECLENQREIPGNGTAEQRTTNGIMVYRPEDASTIFTSGGRTWINGPRGLLERPSDQRFEWEADRRAIDAVQRGGHYIYFRHGATNRNEQDSDPSNLANCATQRNLTDEGRAQARAIGEAFRTLGIPVGRVLSSEYCRALEFARLAFDRADPEPSLVLPDPLPVEERQRNTEALLRILTSPPPSDTNVVMVAHSPNIRDAAGVDLPVEGGAVILKPNPGDKPTTVLRVLPGEWATLAQVLGRR